MLLHGLIFLAVLLVFVMTGRRKGKREGQWKGRSWFVLTAMAGNLLGSLLSLQGRAHILTSEEYVIPKEESAYYEELLVYSEGESYALTLLIPERKADEEEKAEKAEVEEADASKALQNYITSYNAEQEDSEYYYLPEYWEDSALRYGKPESPDGRILAALAFLAAGAVGILKGQEEEREKKKRQERMLLDYPGFVMKFTLLLSAGLSARSAFVRMAQDYSRDGRKREVYDQVTLTCREMESGISELSSFRRFGERCGQIRYRTFSVLLLQNLRSGGSRLSDLLEKESIDAWEERKRQAKIQGDKAQTRLLLPMGMMLILVIAVIMIPAFLSL